jgi:protein involved in polysaccharide export with SLBB domain
MVGSSVSEGRVLASATRKRGWVAALCRLIVLPLTINGAAPALGVGGRVLTPMDVVTIRIVGAPDLDTTARVEEDGTIAFPYLGRIKAAGLTESELAQRIERGLIQRKILADP